MGNSDEAQLACRERARQWLEAYWDRQFYLLFGHVSEQMVVDRSLPAVMVLSIWRKLLADESDADENLADQMLERLDVALTLWYRQVRKEAHDGDAEPGSGGDLARGGGSDR